MITFLLGIIAYLIGAIPFSYVLVKLFYKLDITQLGSGNAGALNSYEVTGNRLIGLFVMILDLLKGYSIIFFYFLFPDITNLLVMSFWVVMGHNFSIFIKFKGGRGLATAAGVMIAINPFFLILWLLMWVMGYYVIKKNVHVANSIATVGAVIMAFSSPEAIFKIFDYNNIGNYTELKFLLIAIAIIILNKHIKPLKELFIKNG